MGSRSVDENVVSWKVVGESKGEATEGIQVVGVRGRKNKNDRAMGGMLMEIRKDLMVKKKDGNGPKAQKEGIMEEDIRIGEE